MRERGAREWALMSVFAGRAGRAYKCRGGRGFEFDWYYAVGMLVYDI